ncbi:hypothetical protein J6590_010209 [Homalodisca vitripennis]|nr:hypothetical protein J6590_010209 [Homalodisca vitripennis]
MPRPKFTLVDIDTIVLDTWLIQSRVTQRRILIADTVTDHCPALFSTRCDSDDCPCTTPPHYMQQLISCPLFTGLPRQ